MSILAIQSSTLKPIHTYNNYVIKSNTKLLAKGYIFLNGYKVRIADTLKDSVKLINKESRYTGIKAKIVKDKIGNERLQLISQKRNVNIYDPSNLLADFIKNRQLGLESNRLIQIIGNSSIGKSVIINYSNEKQKQEIHNPLKLTSNTITELSKIEYLKSPKIVNQILNIAQENAYIEEWIAPNNPYEIYENSDYYKGLVDLFKESDDIANIITQNNTLKRPTPTSPVFDRLSESNSQSLGEIEYYSEDVGLIYNIQGSEDLSNNNSDNKFTEAKLIINKLKVTIFEFLQDHCKNLDLVNGQLMNDIQDTISKLEKLNLNPIQPFSLKLSAYKENIAECSIQSDEIDYKYIELNEKTKAFLEQRKNQILHNFIREQKDLKIKSLLDLNILIEGILDEIEIERAKENLQIKNYSAPPKQILHNNHNSLNELNEKSASAPPKTSISRYDKLVYLEQKIDKADKSIEDFEVDAYVDLENSDGTNLDADNLNFIRDLNFREYEELEQKIEKFEEIRSNNLIGYKNIYTSLKGQVNGKEIPQNSTRQLDLTVDAASYKTNSVPLLIDYLSNRKELLDQYVYIIELIEDYEKTLYYKMF